MFVYHLSIVEAEEEEVRKYRRRHVSQTTQEPFKWLRKNKTSTLARRNTHCNRKIRYRVRTVIDLPQIIFDAMDLAILVNRRGKYGMRGM